MRHSVGGKKGFNRPLSACFTLSVFVINFEGLPVDSSKRKSHQSNEMESYLHQQQGECLTTHSAVRAKGVLLRLVELYVYFNKRLVSAITRNIIAIA